jgi:hypothetical protein
MTIVTVMMWACVGILGMLAIGFFICCVLMLFGMVWQRDDREMVFLYGMMMLFSALCCTGLVFAVIAMWRNLL